jgi:hypothetical protein
MALRQTDRTAYCSVANAFFAAKREGQEVKALRSKWGVTGQHGVLYCAKLLPARPETLLRVAQLSAPLRDWSLWGRGCWNRLRNWENWGLSASTGKVGEQLSGRLPSCGGWPGSFVPLRTLGPSNEAVAGHPVS